jgi:hypothetical protein
MHVYCDVRYWHENVISNFTANPVKQVGSKASRNGQDRGVTNRSPLVLWNQWGVCQ